MAVIADKEARALAAAEALLVVVVVTVEFEDCFVDVVVVDVDFVPLLVVFVFVVVFIGLVDGARLSLLVVTWNLLACGLMVTTCADEPDVHPFVTVEVPVVMVLSL